MAILKEIELESGVTVRYHRVSSVDISTNMCDFIRLTGYTSKAKREEELAAMQSGEQHNVFMDTRMFAAPYGSCPTIARAYEWVKANVPEFADAEDVFDEGDPSDEVSDEEFVSMLKEVM